MDNFSISQLQQYSGIKAHTIRIWEQRYSALKPTRSEGNTRYYDNTQLRRLLNIVSLSSDGYKVSKLCKMNDDELFSLLDEKLASDAESEGRSAYYITQLVAATTGYDEALFDNIFSKSIQSLGMRNTYSDVIYPMLNRIGLMWNIDGLSPAHEHFSSNLIKQKIFSAIEEIGFPDEYEETWLLFLPENEFHEIGLLFSYYLLRQAGKKVIYLGNNMPFETLKSAAVQTNATHLLFFMVRNNEVDTTNEYLSRISKRFHDKKIYASGHLSVIENASKIKGINWLHSAEDFENKLK